MQIAADMGMTGKCVLSGGVNDHECLLTGETPVNWVEQRCGLNAPGIAPYPKPAIAGIACCSLFRLAVAVFDTLSAIGIFPFHGVVLLQSLAAGAAFEAVLVRDSNA